MHLVSVCVCFMRESLRVCLKVCVCVCPWFVCMGVCIRGKLGSGTWITQHGDIYWLSFSVQCQVLSSHSASSLAHFWGDCLSECLRPVQSRSQGHRLASDFWESLSYCPFFPGLYLCSIARSPLPHLSDPSADPGCGWEFQSLSSSRLIHYTLRLGGLLRASAQSGQNSNLRPDGQGQGKLGP